MTNLRPIRFTQKLPEYGDCLLALQTDEPWALLEFLHTGPFQPCYATALIDLFLTTTLTWTSQ